MDANEVRDTLRGGGMVYGFMLSAIGVTRWGPAIAGSTVDYAVIDWEHGSRDRKEVNELCQMLRQAGVAPVVRVPEPRTVWVAMALDAGAAGILVPYCEDVDEVRACVATARAIEVRSAGKSGQGPSSIFGIWSPRSSSITSSCPGGTRTLESWSSTSTPSRRKTGRIGVRSSIATSSIVTSPPVTAARPMKLATSMWSAAMR